MQGFNALHVVCCDGGDGGNRTRVRKIRPADIYERSRVFDELGSSFTSDGHSRQRPGTG
jgi:hypothetical protein